MVPVGSKSWPLQQQQPVSFSTSAIGQGMVVPQQARQWSWPQQVPSAAAGDFFIPASEAPRNSQVPSTSQQLPMYPTPSAGSTALHLQMSQCEPLLATGSGLTGYDLNPCYQLSMAYATPAFHLFLSWPHPLQWWIILDPSKAAAQGPFTGEQMLISYVRQIFSDSVLVCGMAAAEFAMLQQEQQQHYDGSGGSSCGITEGGTYYLPPPSVAAFVPLGQLFEGVRQGIPYQPYLVNAVKLQYAVTTPPQ
jgi:hypothetical protein